jgi:hypothetical protein
MGRRQKTKAAAPDLLTVIDDVRDAVFDLTTVLHILVGSTERAFDRDRATQRNPSYPNLLSFGFTEDSVVDMEWLAAQAWGKAKDLIERIAEYQAAIDAQEPS